jgi:5-hydroxyisourate hydrolase
VTLSTHVLDVSIGRPAASVTVAVQRRESVTWLDVSRDVTNADGRVATLVPPGSVFPSGAYRIVFDVGEYFARRGVESFYSNVTIEFIVRDAAAHYHVPLLVSPYAYSTYRGS